jgi:hypothetical protein
MDITKFILLELIRLGDIRHLNNKHKELINTTSYTVEYIEKYIKDNIRVTGENGMFTCYEDTLVFKTCNEEVEKELLEIMEGTPELLDLLPNEPTDIPTYLRKGIELLKSYTKEENPKVVARALLKFKEKQ